MTATNTTTQTQPRQWVSSAGPRQVKQVEKALRSLHSEHVTKHHLSGITGKEERESVIVEMFGTYKRADVTKAQDAIGNRFGYIITRDNYKEIVSAVNMALSTLKESRPVVDERITPEQYDERMRKLSEAQEARKVKAEQEKQAMDDLAQKYPYLIQDNTRSCWSLGAKNIRIELKRAFPGFKFRVVSDSFSMGCSIDVSWIDGPTESEVGGIVKKYEYGTFDAMTDCSGIDHNSYNWSKRFGGAKYVQCQRNSTLAGFRAAWEKDGNKDAEQITEGGTYGYQYQGSADLFRDVSRVYRETSLYTKPEKALEGTTTANTSTGETTITEHTHTKKGFQMWIVQIENRVSRGRFDELLSIAKGKGGWYSRKWGNTPAGFAFKDNSHAQEFAEAL